MGIIRGTLPQDNYTQISNSWLRDPRTTYKEKGILAAIASHREDYELTVEQLIAQSKDGRDSVYSGLRGLVEVGYLVVERRRDEMGRLGETDFRLVEPPPLPDSSKSGKARSGSDQVKRSSGESDSSKSGKARSGEPTSGKSSSGKSDTKKTTHQEDHRVEDDSVPPAEERLAAETEDSSASSVQTALVGDDTSLAPKEPSLRDRSMGIAGKWMAAWKDRTKKDIAGDNVKHKISKAVEQFLKIGYTDLQVMNALVYVSRGVPTPGMLEAALIEVEKGWIAPKDWVPGDTSHRHRTNGQPRTGAGRANGQRNGTGPMAGTNLFISDITPEQRAAQNPFAQAVRSSDVRKEATA